MVKRLLAIGLVVGLGFVLAMPARAVTLNQGLTANVLNTIEDQDREAYVDANGNGLIDVGDVFVGFVRFDNFGPVGLPSDNQVYTVFSNQITSIDLVTNTATLGTTTVAGLTLLDITGNAATAGGMFAVYDNAVPFSVDLIATSPPGATSVKDDNDLVVGEGTLQLVVGLAAIDDYFLVEITPSIPLGGLNAPIAELPVSATVGNFTAGLSVLFNATPFTFADSVFTIDVLGGFHVNQVGVGNGAIRGAIGDGEEGVFTDASGYGAFTQCTTPAGNTICGFATDADFFVFPTQVSAPMSLTLLGSALVGLASLARLRRKP